MKKLTINNSFYYSCGDKWWPDTKYGRVGLGISREWLTDDRLIVNVDGEDYELDCIEAREFIKENNSWEVRKNVKIGYIPKSLLHEKENSRSTKKKTLADIQPIHPKERQGDLFHVREEVSDQ